MISIVIVAILLGTALRRAKSEQIGRGESSYLAVESGVVTTFRAIEIILSWAIQLVPLAVFGVVARTVGRYGFEPFKGLVVYLAVGMLGLGIQVAVVYQLWIKFVARMPLRRFWAGAHEAVVYAMGTASSLASLPMTLRTLQKMQGPPQSARMAACVGTNLNNDGILLYEAMAVLFVAQASGIHLSLADQLLAAGACAIAGIGISGVPEAGLISLIIVVRTVHLPETIVPLLLTVDWVLGRCRAMTNVVSDLIGGRTCSTGSLLPSPVTASMPRYQSRPIPSATIGRRLRRSRRWRARTNGLADTACLMTPTGFEPVLHA